MVPCSCGSKSIKCVFLVLNATTFWGVSAQTHWLSIKKSQLIHCIVSKEQLICVSWQKCTSSITLRAEPFVAVHMSCNVPSIVNRGDWLWSPTNIKGANKDDKIYIGRSTTLHNLLLCPHTLCMNYVTNTFLLVSSSVRSKQLLCFVQGQGQKTEQQHTTNNFDEFHNHSPPLTMYREIKDKAKRDERGSVRKVNLDQSWQKVFVECVFYGHVWKGKLINISSSNWLTWR